MRNMNSFGSDGDKCSKHTFKFIICTSVYYKFQSASMLVHAGTDHSFSYLNKSKKLLLNTNNYCHSF